MGSLHNNQLPSTIPVSTYPSKLTFRASKCAVLLSRSPFIKLVARDLMLFRQTDGHLQSHWHPHFFYAEITFLERISPKHLNLSLLCVERAQTAQQYSTTERRSAVAVILMMWGGGATVRPMQLLYQSRTS